MAISRKIILLLLHDDTFCVWHPNDYFEYGYPHSNALLHLFTFKILILSQIGVLQAT